LELRWYNKLRLEQIKSFIKRFASYIKGGLMGVRGQIIKKTMHAPLFLNKPVQYGSSFSRGIRVNLGNFTLLFISGTASLDKQGKSVHLRNFTAQARRTFDNLSALLRSEGANWDNVVQTRCYLKDMRHYNEFNRVRNAFYSKQRMKLLPASVCIGASLCRPELLVEIELIAIIKEKENS
jgi:2-iminobutanoate/2-iminopropanoate deaminase